ncbi:hypothetical protein JCM5350_003438 [Sporobolomyces pararoseus]
MSRMATSQPSAQQNSFDRATQVEPTVIRFSQAEVPTESSLSGDLPLVSSHFPWTIEEDRELFRIASDKAHRNKNKINFAAVESHMKVYWSRTRGNDFSRGRAAIEKRITRFRMIGEVGLDPISYVCKRFTCEEDEKLLALETNVRRGQGKPGVNWAIAITQFEQRPRFELRARRRQLVTEKVKKEKEGGSLTLNGKGKKEEAVKSNIVSGAPPLSDPVTSTSGTRVSQAQIGTPARTTPHDFVANIPRLNRNLEPRSSQQPSLVSFPSTPLDYPSSPVVSNSTSFQSSLSRFFPPPSSQFYRNPQSTFPRFEPENLESTTTFSEFFNSRQSTPLPTARSSSPIPHNHNASSTSLGSQFSRPRERSNVETSYSTSPRLKRNSDESTDESITPRKKSKLNLLVDFELIGEGIELFETIKKRYEQFDAEWEKTMEKGGEKEDLLNSAS